MVWVSRPKSDCFLGFKAASVTTVPGSGSHGPEQEGQKILLFPPASPSTWTQSSQKTRWHLTHFTIARASRWLIHDKEPSARVAEVGGGTTFSSGIATRGGSLLGRDSRRRSALPRRRICPGLSGAS